MIRVTLSEEQIEELKRSDRVTIGIEIEQVDVGPMLTNVLQAWVGRENSGPMTLMLTLSKQPSEVTVG